MGKGIEKFEMLEQDIRHYRWLKEISERYQQMIDLIEREREHFIICGFSYEARSEPVSFNVNPHRSIPYTFILDGMKAALGDVNKEIAEYEKKIDDYFD